MRFVLTFWKLEGPMSGALGRGSVALASLMGLGGHFEGYCTADQNPADGVIARGTKTVQC